MSPILWVRLSLANFCYKLVQIQFYMIISPFLLKMSSLVALILPILIYNLSVYRNYKAHRSIQISCNVCELGQTINVSLNENSSISIPSVSKVFVRIQVHNYKMAISLVTILIKVSPKQY